MPQNNRPRPTADGRDCDCDACRRIRGLDEQAQAAAAAQPQETPVSDYWDDNNDWAWEDSFEDSEEPRVARPSGRYAAPEPTPAPTPAQLADSFQQVSRMLSSRREQETAAATARNNILETLETPERCSICSAMAEMYAVEDRLVCESCYHRECTRLFCCHTCDTNLSPGECYEFETHRYCRRCIVAHQDYCNNCGAIEAHGSMRRDNRQRATCRGCYRPEWKPGEWRPARNSYNFIPRGFTYGVELETSHSENYADLEGQTAWGCVPEASTSGREFVSPVLKGDAGLAEVENFINKWGSDWDVDSYCGTHIHIGLHKFSLEQKRRIAYAYHSAWSFIAYMIGPNRSNNSMCGAPQWTLADLMEAGDIEDFAEARDRFEFVNWRSLLKYGTIEVRCLKGTLDVDLINAWIRWHCKFIKKVASMSLPKLQKQLMDVQKFCTELDPDLVLELNSRMGVNHDAETANPAPRRRSRPNRLEAEFSSYGNR